MPRQMPKAGYYKRHFNPLADKPGDVDIIYCTGTYRQNRYYRILWGRVPDGWAKLDWTCVPTVKRMEENYDYYPDLPPGIPPIDK